MKESDLERALICLSRKFKVVCNTDNKLDLALVMSVMQSYTSVDSPVRKHCEGWYNGIIAYSVYCDKCVLQHNESV